MPALVVIFGRDRGHFFNIPRGSKLVIGRSPSLTHRLNDPSISREHLEFVLQESSGMCLVNDLASRNGARINKKRLFHSHELRDGDIIQVGYTLLVFVRVTFDANSSILDFLNTCENEYSEYLRRLRDHAAMHIDKEDSRGYDSSTGMSGTLHLGSLFGKKT